MAPLVIAGVVVVVLLIILSASIRVVQEYERGVIFRLGRVLEGAKGPGLFFLIPIIDRMVKVNLQIVTLDVPPQDVITRDNVTIRVNAVVYFQVFQPVKAIVEVQNYLFATSQIAQTTLRAVLSKVDLDDILSERDRLNQDLQRIIDDLTDPWGIKVNLVEIKDVDLPTEMQRAMAKQAEAERERRAKIINAEGEFQASERLAQAAQVIARHPIAYQLRYLQTITDVAAEQNSTLVVPIPVEMLKAFEAAFGKDVFPDAMHERTTEADLPLEPIEPDPDDLERNTDIPPAPVSPDLERNTEIPPASVPPPPRPPGTPPDHPGPGPHTGPAPSGDA